MTLRPLALALAFLAALPGARAADLRIGALTDPAVDPHYLYLSTNMAYSRHVFDALVRKDDNSQPYPGLATEWTALDDTTWEFKLRRGVKFHDGQEFTAEDVVFSLKRVPAIPNNPNPYTTNMRAVDKVEVIDPYTIRIRTKGPSPTLPANLGNIYIVSHKAAANALPADFRSGKAAVGTGPYRFVQYVPAERLVLTRFEDYWDEKPIWQNVTFRIIANDQSRVAALLAGDVDVIDFVAPADVEGLRKNPRTQVFQRSSDRIIYLVADVGREPTPHVTDKQGRPLAKNPLKDLRVRQAISKAINRPLMVDRVMEGLASAASQLVPEGFLGYSPNLKVEPYDPEGAKRLLAAAGYPDGFALTLHGPNDRYMNDEKVAQAAAQMLSRVGIQTRVEVMTKQIYFTKINPPNAEFSLMLLGWGSSATGESAHTLPGLFHSYDKARGFGFVNNGNYSNPELDRLVVDAIATVDRAQRDRKLQQAMEMAIADLLVIPLHNQFTVMATRKGFVYVPRADEYTLAMNTKPAP